MRIKLSKSQWRIIGEKAGWICTSEYQRSEHRKMWTSFYRNQIDPVADRLQKAYSLPFPPPQDEGVFEFLGKHRVRMFHINVIMARILRDWNIWLYSSTAQEAESAYSLWYDSMKDFVAGLENMQGVDARTGQMASALGPLLEEFRGGTPQESPWTSLQRSFDIHFGFIKKDWDAAFPDDPRLHQQADGSMLRDYRTLAQIVFEEKMANPDKHLRMFLNQNTKMSTQFESYDEWMDEEANTLAQWEEQSETEKLSPEVKMLRKPTDDTPDKT